MTGVWLAATLDGEVSVSPVGTAGAAETCSAASSEIEGDVEHLGRGNSEVYHYPNCADVHKI